MKERSRTSNALNNTKMGMIFKLVNLVGKFVMRTVFIYCLGRDYVGVNGVFSNILSVLSLAELGIGSAIVYDAYKPIAKNDYDSLAQLFDFYKKIYRVIGLLIFTAGLCLCPFLRLILKDVPQIQNLTLIYILTLLSTASSYFFAQYSSMIEAHQQQGMVLKYRTVSSICKAVMETAVVIAFRSYVLFLISDITVTLFTNYLIARKALRMYPFLKRKVPRMEKDRIKKIWGNSISVFSIKTASTVVNSTDNILISAMIGTAAAGSYSTYLLIVMSVQQVIYTLKSAVLASVGNLCAIGSELEKYNVFNRMFFIFAWINCIVVCCFMVLLQPFIKMWAGEDYLLSMAAVSLITLNYYLRGLQWPVELFIQADGLYRYFRIKPWVEVLLNIVFSVLFAKKLGVTGVLLGTMLSELLTTFWYDPAVVYKQSFHVPLSDYWKSVVVYTTITVVLVAVSVFSTQCIQIGEQITQFMLCVALAGGIPLALFWLPFYRSDEFRFVWTITHKYMVRTKHCKKRLRNES